MPGKLLSVVGRNRVQEFPVRPERRNHGIGQVAGILRGERFQNAEVGLPVVCGEDVADVVRAVDQVDFKVSETVLRVDRGGSERNRYAARDGAAPVLERAPLAVRLPAVLGKPAWEDSRLVCDCFLRMPGIQQGFNLVS